MSHAVSARISCGNHKRNGGGQAEGGHEIRTPPPIRTVRVMRIEPSGNRSDDEEREACHDSAHKKNQRGAEKSFHRVSTNSPTRSSSACTSPMRLCPGRGRSRTL